MRKLVVGWVVDTTRKDEKKARSKHKKKRAYSPLDYLPFIVICDFAAVKAIIAFCFYQCDNVM